MNKSLENVSSKKSTSSAILLKDKDLNIVKL